MKSTSLRPHAHTLTWGPLIRLGLVTVVAAVIANLIVYLIGNVVIPYDPQFAVLATVFPTILFTVVPAIGAVLLYAALLRGARTPARTFTIIAAVVFVVSLIPDFVLIPTMLGATGGQTAILVLMHIVAASVITGVLLTRTRDGDDIAA